VNIRDQLALIIHKINELGGRLLTVLAEKTAAANSKILYIRCIINDKFMDAFVQDGEVKFQAA